MKINLSNAIEKDPLPVDHTQRQLKKAFDQKYASYLDELTLYEDLLDPTPQSESPQVNDVPVLTPEEEKIEREIVEIRHFKLSTRLQKEKADLTKKYGGRVQDSLSLDLSQNMLDAKFMKANSKVIGELSALAHFLDLNLSYNRLDN